MKELFEDMYMGFFEEPQLQTVVSDKKQAQYDYYANLIIEGEGFLPNDKDEFVRRKITKKEEEELYYRLGKFLQSLN